MGRYEFGRSYLRVRCRYLILDRLSFDCFDGVSKRLFCKELSKSPTAHLTDRFRLVKYFLTVLSIDIFSDFEPTKTWRLRSCGTPICDKSKTFSSTTHPSLVILSLVS